MSSSSSGAKNYIPMQNKYDRVVLLVDMDCFYCQVEEKLDSSLVGQPIAVVQYNAWRGGGIIAVNYAARAKGVTRHMRGDEAKVQCADIRLVKVPNVRNKADLSKYRDAGKEVANVLQRFTPLLERASVDEAYLDISQAVNKRLEEMNAGSFVLQPNELHNTYAVGYENIGAYIGEITARFAEPYSNDEEYHCAHDANDVPAVRKSDLRLLIGASLANEIRAAVKQITGYDCSAGVAHNKILAKLACGMNKPNKQTILPLSQIPTLFETLPIGKIKGLGAKYGDELCEKLGIRFLGQLMKFTEAELQRKFDDKNGSWLYNIARGIDLETVTPRFYSKSIGCCKKFPGRNNITALKTLSHWLGELANEISERLDKDIGENNRRAKQMVVSFIQDIDGEEISSSRSAPLNSYEKEALVKNSLDLIKANTKQFLKPGSSLSLNNPLKFLGISVGKFETINNSQSKLKEMFANQAAKKKIPEEQQNEKVETAPNGVDQLEYAQMPEPMLDKKKSVMLNYLASCGTKKSSELKDKAEICTARDEVNCVSTEDAGRNIRASNDSVVTLENITSDKTPELNFYLKEKEKCEQSSMNMKKSFFFNALKQQNEIETTLKNTDKDINSIDDLQQLKCDIEMVESEVITNNVENINAENLEDCIYVPEFFSQENAETPSCSKLTTQISLQTDPNYKLSLSPKKFKRKHADLSDSATSHTECLTHDYETNYAEYAVPELRPELLQCTVCSICKASVPSDERSIQMHQDHHMAQQLSQQQRIEYRQEITTKIASTTSTKSPSSSNKKLKKSSHKSADISKFLKPSQSNSLNSSLNIDQPTCSSSQAASNADLMSICPECKTAVASAQMDEHSDYHIAKNLQRKLNQLEVRTVTITKKPSHSNNQRKKLNNSTSQLNATKSITASKSITEFFSQPNS